MTHKVGNPNLQLHVIIRNVGGRRVRIKKIKARLVRNNKDIADLPAQTYLKEPNDKNPVLLTSFSLSPNEEWAHLINFFNFFERNEEKKYRTMEVGIKKNIFSKRIGVDEKEIVEADNEFVTPFIDFFNDKFIWLPGEYKLFLSIQTDKDKADIQKTYRFTLFESDSEDLAQIKNEYKRGAGIYWDSGTQTSVILNITEDQ